MRNEDELMIALDIIKTYSEAAQLNGQQLNDAIAKIDQVKLELLKASKTQAKSTVQSELAEPLKEFNENADKFWAQGAYLVNELKKQSDQHRWRNSFLFGIGMMICIGSMMLGIFLWLPSLDEIKQRRAEYSVLKEYGFDIKTCDGKKCVQVEKNKCNYGDRANYCIAVVK